MIIMTVSDQGRDLHANIIWSTEVGQFEASMADARTCGYEPLVAQMKGAFRRRS